MCGYKNPGDSLTAAEWNDLFSAQDAALTNYLGGLSPFLAGADNVGATKKFFFFNPVVLDSANLHPLAASAIGAMTIEPAFKRQYNHAAITGIISSLAPDSGLPVAISPSFKVVRLSPPSQSAWAAAVYPETAFGVINLDACLSVLKSAGNATYIAAALNGAVTSGFEGATAERSHAWDQIEIFINSNLNWDAAWDKYNFFRVHNFGILDFTAFGFTIPVGQCRCVRRNADGTFSEGFNYFQKMTAGDPRFFYLADYFGFPLAGGGGPTPDGGPPASFPGLFSPLETNSIIANEMANFTPVDVLTNTSARRDFTKFWDMNQAYSKLFPVPAMATLIGDMLVHKGTFLAVRWGTAFSHRGGTLIPAVCETKTINFSGFSAIASALSQANSSVNGSPSGINWSFNNSTGIATFSFQTPSGSFVDLIDVSTNLISFLTGAYRWQAISGALSPIIGMMARTPRLAATNRVTNYTYNLYAYDGEKYNVVGTRQVTVNNQVYSYNSADVDVGTETNGVATGFSLLDSAQKLSDFVSGLNCPLISVKNIQLILTPYGVAICWQEKYSIANGFDPALINLNENITFFFPVAGQFATQATILSSNFIWLKQSGNSLVIQRGFLINSAFANNPFPPNNPYKFDPYNPTPWHFPRSARLFAPLRTVNHDGTKEPWQPTNAPYTSQEPPNVKRFFENTPIASESVEPFQSANFTYNVSRMGKKDVLPTGNWGSDTSGLLLGLWYGSTLKGAIDYEAYLRAVSDAARTPNATERALVNGSAIQLPNQVEHYNMVASMTNGFSTSTAKKPFGGSGSLAAGNFVPPHAPGSVPLAKNVFPYQGANSPFFKGFFPRNCFFSWTAPTDGNGNLISDPIENYFATQGISTIKILPDNYGTATRNRYGKLKSGVYSTEDGADGDWLIDPDFQKRCSLYRYITIDSARTLYSKFSIPFQINGTYAPSSFKIIEGTFSKVASSNNYSTASGLDAPAPSTPMSGNVWVFPDGNFHGDCVLYSSDFRTRYYAFQLSGSTDGLFLENVIGTSLGANVYQYIPQNSTSFFDETTSFPILAAQFVPDVNGSWLGHFDGQDVGSGQINPLMFAGKMTVRQDFSTNIAGTFPASDYAAGNFTVYKWTVTTRSYVNYYYLDFGVGVASNGCPRIKSISLLSENIRPWSASVLPKNYYTYNISAQSSDPPLSTNFLSGIFPIIVDNTVEGNSPEITYIDGTGGVGAYEHVINTNLANAKLIVMPVDGQV